MTKKHCSSCQDLTNQLFQPNDTGFGNYCYFLTTADENLTFMNGLFSFLRLMPYYKPPIILFGISYMDFLKMLFALESLIFVVLNQTNK